MKKSNLDSLRNKMHKKLLEKSLEGYKRKLNDKIYHAQFKR